jgi:hypothetical protein
MDGWLLGRSVAAFASGVDDGAREVGRHGTAPRPDAPAGALPSCHHDAGQDGYREACHDVYRTMAEMLQTLCLGGDDTRTGVWQAGRQAGRQSQSQRYRMRPRPIAARRVVGWEKGKHKADEGQAAHPMDAGCDTPRNTRGMQLDGWIALRRWRGENVASCGTARTARAARRSQEPEQRPQQRPRQRQRQRNTPR